MVNQAILWNAFVLDVERQKKEKQKKLDQIELMNVFVKDAEKDKRKGLTIC